MNRRHPIGATLAAGAAVLLLLGSAQVGCGDGTPARADGSAVTSDGADAADAADAGTDGDGRADTRTPADTAGTGCKDQEVNVTADITTDTTWPCNTYVLTRPIHVTNGATLTIAAGSTIFGNGNTTTPAALISTREGKLVAVGTATAPIVFTSYAPVGARVPGDTFAGVVMLGKAKLNGGTCSSNGAPAGTGCNPPGFFQATLGNFDPTDGRARFGGTDDTHNCGELKYVRVEFAGAALGADAELDGLSIGACGSQTRISYVQVHRGFADGVQMLGGTASLDHILIDGAGADSLDWDNGWTGRAQFLIAHQAYSRGGVALQGNSLAANERFTPRSAPEIWNATLIGETGRVGMHLGTGTYYKLRNFVVQGFGGGLLDVEAKDAANLPATDWPTTISLESSVFFSVLLGRVEMPAVPDAGPATDNDMGFDEAVALTAPARMNTLVDPMLGSIDIAAPSYVPGDEAAVTGKATPAVPFDVTATYAGAVAPGTAPAAAWYAGWTSFPEK